jgi:serine/threonine-protein kinase
MSNLVGQTLGRYKITSLLGEGGMGAVYKARDDMLKRDVAIKVMNPQYARMANFQERFLQEARTVARISHPGVVQVYDFGEAQAQLYIVMEFIRQEPGPDIERNARPEHLDHAERSSRDRAPGGPGSGLRAPGVLHRYQADNVMLRPEPSEGLPYRPVITDLTGQAQW